MDRPRSSTSLSHGWNHEAPGNLEAGAVLWALHSGSLVFEVRREDSPAEGCVMEGGAY